MTGIDLVKQYFPNLSEEQERSFASLDELYREWNDKINVISRKDVDNLYERHVLHSLGIAKITNFASRAKVIDVGTGGGFPGIPLAILFPECEFLLIDGTGKKILVVNELINALGLSNARGLRVRSEDHQGKYDFIVSRAVTNLPDFLHKTHHLLNKGGSVLYLKGGDLREEFEAVDPMPTYHPLNEFFEQEFFETKGVVVFP